MPRILKNNSNLFQLMRRSIPTIRMTAAMKIRGVAALEVANLLKAAATPVSSGMGAEVLLDEDPREVLERAGFLAGLLFEPAEEPEERDLPVFAIFS